MPVVKIRGCLGDAAGLPEGGYGRAKGPAIYAT